MSTGTRENRDYRRQCEGSLLRSCTPEQPFGWKGSWCSFGMESAWCHSRLQMIRKATMNQHQPSTSTPGTGAAKADRPGLPRASTSIRLVRTWMTDPVLTTAEPMRCLNRTNVAGAPVRRRPCSNMQYSSCNHICHTQCASIGARSAVTAGKDGSDQTSGSALSIAGARRSRNCSSVVSATRSLLRPTTSTQCQHLNYPCP
ncbi:hypothetical protein IWX90DRAFT_314031 [Phyllosticta citrichinensis]|uniref:Uncharacterized protein n=1 Tax=Phyllosticta citrichinensis TaxID=1130410 RepID=A0ABR1XJ21_9PEZI